MLLTGTQQLLRFPSQSLNFTPVRATRGTKERKELEDTPRGERSYWKEVNS